MLPWKLCLYLAPFIVPPDTEGRLRLETVKSKHTRLWQVGPRTAPGHVVPHPGGASTW